MQLAASCRVYHGLLPGFSMHFKSIATFLAKSANKKNPFGRRKVASAKCKLSVNHITITLAIQWRHLGVGTQCLASAGPQLQHERGGAYWQTKALQTSFVGCHQILTSSRTERQRQNDDLRFCLPCEKGEWEGGRTGRQ